MGFRVKVWHTCLKRTCSIKNKALAVLPYLHFQKILELWCHILRSTHTNLLFDAQMKFWVDVRVNSLIDRSLFCLCLFYFYICVEAAMKVNCIIFFNWVHLQSCVTLIILVHSKSALHRWELLVLHVQWVLLTLQSGQYYWWWYKMTRPVYTSCF